MNKRAHIRHDVKLPAVLTSGHFRDRSCQVENFCLGGVLLSIPHEDLALMAAMQKGETLTLGVDVPGRQGTRRVNLPAEVVRKEPRALGVAFRGAPATDLLTLQNHVRALLEQRTSPSAASQERAEPARRQQAASRARALLQDFCNTRLDDFHGAVRDAVRAETSRLASDEEREPLIETVTVLQSNSNTLARNFLSKVSAELDRLVAGLDQQGPEFSGSATEDSRLSLVDKSSFEDWLALKVMASRAEVRTQRQLLYLQLRFDELFGISLDPRRNPVSPTHLCNAFGESVRLLPLKEKADRLVLSVFEKEVLAGLDDLYRQLNEALAAEGVLPELDVGRYLSERYGGPVAEQTLRAYGHEEAADELPGGADRASGASPGKRARPSAGAIDSFSMQQNIARNAYATVQRLMGSAAEAFGEGGSGGPPVEPAQLDATLTGMQARREDSSEPLPQQIEAMLRERMGGPVSPGPELSTAMNVIHHLFEGILEDPALSEGARKSIRQLQIPLLRLLLSDDSFLSDTEHPVRQLLNRMAQLGRKGTSGLEKKEAAISEQVDHVLDNFDEDVAVFAEALERLEPLVRPEEKRFERNVKRVTEACEGRERVAAARNRVGRILERLAGGRKTPRALLSLVDAGWRELLVQTLLRQGSAGEQWQRYLAVPQRMMEAVAIVPAREELQPLLATIKEGLAQVDDTQLQNARLIGELRDLLSKKARDEKDPPLVDVPAGLLSGQEDQDQAVEEDSARSRRLERYKVGDWFSTGSGEDEALVRLAWIGGEGQTYVFVNQKGMKIIEYSRAELLQGLTSAEMRPVDSLDAPPVDRGLEAMVRGIYEQMARQSARDELTGLANRREFERCLRLDLEKASDGGVLLHVDLDRFELINNQGGPAAGDDMLRALARLLEERFPGKLVARPGGDEFAVWLSDADADGARAQADKLLEQVAGTRFECAGKSFQTTISCGLAERVSPGVSAAELMRAADSACHAAKEAGRNRVEGGGRQGGGELARREDLMSWVSRLNEAMDDDRLSLRVQRIEATSPDGSAPAYEALISLRAKDGEMLPPAEFMRAAEQYNRMHAVDRWVIERVLRWMHENPETVSGLDHVAINLSGHSLNDTSLLEFIFERLAQYPVRREQLCFEVTETATIARLDEAIDFIQAVRDLGCRFSLDDFGAGQASYGHLRSLPVDYIKIDGSFIRDIVQDKASRAMVRSMNEMGHLMGKKTIAEFVETQEIRDCLREMGVDFVQGYCIEKPRPMDSLARA